MALGWLVLALVFVDELLAVAAAYVAGQHAAGWWLGVPAALLVVAVWSLFASPRARYGGPVARPVTKVLVFALASGGLWATGHRGPAVALLVFSVLVNAAAQLPAVRALVADGPVGDTT